MRTLWAYDIGHQPGAAPSDGNLKLRGGRTVLCLDLVWAVVPCGLRRSREDAHCQGAGGGMATGKSLQGNGEDTMILFT